MKEGGVKEIEKKFLMKSETFLLTNKTCSNDFFAKLYCKCFKYFAIFFC